MGRLTVLGSAFAVPAIGQDNAHLLITTEKRHVLIDCGNNPITGLQKLGVDFNQLTDLVLTHFHPDHVAAAPLLLMDMWLLKRKTPLTIHGLGATVSRMETLMDLFEWKTWPNFYPVEFHRLPNVEMAQVVDYPDVRIFSSPVRHMIPTVGLRVEYPTSGKVAAYSCDTEPCDEVANLGRDADALIHESSGEEYGHSSARQAGEVAARAGAKALYLIHYPTDASAAELSKQAATTYSGKIHVARDMDEVDLG